jgi:hypothetical protein
LLRDTGPYLLVAGVVAGISKLVQPDGLSTGFRIGWLVAASAATLLATVGLHAPTRRAVVGWLRLPRASRMS